MLKECPDFSHTGAEIFFPDSRTRRSHLLSMVDQVMEEKKAVSLGLTFESLCRFFSNKDASGLLGLPNAVTEVCSLDYGCYQYYQNATERILTWYVTKCNFFREFCALHFVTVGNICNELL